MTSTFDGRDSFDLETLAVRAGTNGESFKIEAVATIEGRSHKEKARQKCQAGSRFATLALAAFVKRPQAESNRRDARIVCRSQGRGKPAQITRRRARWRARADCAACRPRAWAPGANARPGPDTRASHRR